VSGYVYFIATSFEAGDFVKIGHTGGSPFKRRDCLQTGCPAPLDVMAYIPGSVADEKFLHVFFEDQRAHGEWFSFDGALSELIWSLIAQSEPKSPAPRSAFEAAFRSPSEPVQ